MMLMYHCTRLEFLDEILEHGLRPVRPLERTVKGSRMGPHEGEKVCAVFVSEKPFKWMHWAQVDPDDRYVPGVMITLDVSGLNRIPDPSPNHEGDWAVLEKIPVERFVEIVASGFDDPCSFVQLKEGFSG